MHLKSQRHGGDVPRCTCIKSPTNSRYTERGAIERLDAGRRAAPPTRAEARVLHGDDAGFYLSLIHI